MQRTVASLLILPQPTSPAGIWLHPRGSGPALRGEVGELGAGRGPSLAPGMTVGRVSLVTLA